MAVVVVRSGKVESACVPLLAVSAAAAAAGGIAALLDHAGLLLRDGLAGAGAGTVVGILTTHLVAAHKSAQRGLGPRKSGWIVPRWTWLGFGVGVTLHVVLVVGAKAFS